MSHKRSFFVFAICLFLLIACLAAGYWIAAQRVGAVMAILLGPSWLLARKYPSPWLTLVCLVASVGLSVVGILMEVPPLLMVFGSAMALAVWDLLLLDTAVGTTSVSEQTRQYEKKHLYSLMLALGLGLSVTILGRSFSIQMPFIVLLLFVAFVLFALDRVWSYIKKTGKR
jgi:hypothetical protein